MTDSIFTGIIHKIANEKSNDIFLDMNINESIERITKVLEINKEENKDGFKT